MKSFRDQVWSALENPEDGGWVGKFLHGVILWVIVLTLVAVVAESVPSLRTRFASVFDGFEVFSVLVFTIEYLLRLWSCTSDPRYAQPVRGRIRYACSFMAVVDLLSFLPFYLVFLSLDLRMLRAMRLVRLLRVAKLGRYSQASGILLKVIQSKKEEMLLTMSFLLILSVICATLMYYAEGGIQPDKFPHIPAAMWWAVVTITTVGYGDVFPMTIAGKLIGAMTAIIGILMIALPTGVFGAAFVEELNKRHAARKCPHCGKDIH